MKKLVFLAFSILASCVAVPPYFSGIHSMATEDIPSPKDGHAMIVFHAEHPYFIRVESFNQNSITGMQRNVINAAEFTPRKVELKIGLYRKLGEFNFRKVDAGSGILSLDAKENEKYKITFSSPKVHPITYTLHKQKEDGSYEEIKSVRSDP